ncbi:lysophospholipid acyltransferase family protein [Kitasatospora paracochleata]|uniref:1-acyl-sn-glycerol-3-phosphate acyltransferase n=1 Tax=Kitasatospora paracochleata TaxID=58354 RepID=A0ABT1J4T7_9ACTN|nr:lysophospholipid acyltransferase family protein [Kitasatospora paracochleata]MCP2312076.1 1-acyl-sn-glycerol-3-phosphate acyltransferase [Kitasatospora paracochleata]
MSTWLPTAPCTPGACVAASGPAVAVPWRLLRCAGCLLVLLAGVALVPLVRAWRWLPAERLVRIWTRTLLASLGVRVRAGATAPPAGGALLVANHISWLDILLVAAVRPGRMLAKTEVGQWPVLGPLTTWGGTIFIDRDRLRSLPRTVEQATEALRRGERVVVFPEGSTWCGRYGGRFRPALFEAAVRAGAPVQPLTIRYRLADGSATTAPAFVGEDGLLASLWRVVTVRGLEAELELLPLIPAGRHPGRRELARAAQAAVDLRRFPDGGAVADGPAAAVLHPPAAAA